MNSMLLTDNSNSNTLSAASFIDLGSPVHGYGKGITVQGTKIRISGGGYFRIMATVNASITGTGAATVSLYENGHVIDSVVITPSAAGANVEYFIPWVFRKKCGCIDSDIQLYIDAAATIKNVTVLTEYESR